MFFFEKKNQKTFASFRGAVGKVRTGIKVFWFSFAKKNAFLSECNRSPMQIASHFGSAAIAAPISIGP